MASVPAALALAFACLDAAPGARSRSAYAAYGGVYVSVAALWVWWVEHTKPDRWELIGVARGA